MDAPPQGLQMQRTQFVGQLVQFLCGPCPHELISPVVDEVRVWAHGAGAMGGEVTGGWSAVVCV